ncbi:MAG: hypothetical protein M0001_07740 [Treponema sp.]|nr:hypothetical protein [Treponema sp.]
MGLRAKASAKTVVAIGMVCLLALSSCAKSKTLDLGGSARTVDPYGLWAEFAARDRIDPKVEYRLSVPNLVLSVIFSETIVVPIVLVGWYLWEPAGPKH